MKGHSSIPVSSTKTAITFAGYFLLLLAAALTIPLRIPEVLQMAAMRNLSPAPFFGWIAQTPGLSPLHSILQVPALLVGGRSRLGARFVSLAFAVAACYFFLRLTKRIPLDRPYWALLLFMLLPIHFELSFEARPYEQALFLVVLALECFFRLVSRPGLKRFVLYAGCLTLCLYTERLSFLPAVGYLLSLLRFVDRAGERRAIWYALTATAVPVILFLPYALWAHTQANADWLAGPPAPPLVFIQLIRSVAEERWASYLLCALLGMGVLMGTGASFRMTTGTIQKRIRLFVLMGGICSTLVIGLGLNVLLGYRYASSEVLWAMPAAAILVFAGMEWLGKRREPRSLAFAVPVLLIAVCAVADIEYLLFPSGAMPQENLQENLAALAATVPGQLTRDSCVVFVSERFSRALFLVFEPELASRECLDFFHSRIVLASHPYVKPEQQADAESYFRGLNLAEKKRLYAGGGQIVVMEQQPAK